MMSLWNWKLSYPSFFDQLNAKGVTFLYTVFTQRLNRKTRVVQSLKKFNSRLLWNSKIIYVYTN